MIDALISYLSGLFGFNPDSPLLFTQFHFWAFFAIVFSLFALTKNRSLLRNSYLFFVSLLFYYKTSGWFVGILIFITLSDFLIAQHIYASRSARSRRLWLALSVSIDLGLLCYFKYTYFFADLLNNIFGCHIEVHNILGSLGNSLFGDGVFNADSIVLPVGISFYTFQIISYTVDVYRGLVSPVRNLLDFGFYVSFFPQLVAGPIVKATDFIPQLYKNYFLGRRQYGIAVFWILNGLAKKIILSDYLAVNFVDRVFDNPLLFCGFENLMALFVYSLQVYADFSGYTDIAIGLSMLMGFHLPMNFNSPYKAPNCSNFWKRWHISLSRWLQNYLYIPLGGNRNITRATLFWIALISIVVTVLSGSVWVAVALLTIFTATVITAWHCPERRRKIYANLNSMITMLLGGLWHGASMNFMIWGGLNGAGMVVFKFWRDMGESARVGLSAALTLTLYALATLAPMPLWNVLLVCCALVTLGAAAQWALRRTCYWQRYLSQPWAIMLTFVFISFTRLFFRSGSNLDPAVANEVAWNTAVGMITQIGTAWSTPIQPIVEAYGKVFLLFAIGMVVHWLPTRLKRRYRLTFATMPLPAIVIAAVVTVFILYQFVTAEMQPFIYFQF